MTKLIRATVILSALALAACAAMQQQRAQPVRADHAEFKNLKVLPPNISHDELIATMRGFARAMGRKCEYCHIPVPGGDADQFDFASDANKHKNIARTMILMTRNINSNYVSKIPDEKFPAVTCWTCHRGKTHPEHAPAAPQPQT